jgi:outer membrane protein assembly factor BamD
MEAKRAFEQVVIRYPDSKYAKDAKEKIRATLDHLAAHEMHVARFYQGKGDHLAALNRFKSMISEYPQVVYVPEALHRMVECYLSLGIIDQAKATAHVMAHNYRDNPWYERSFSLLQNVK